MTAIDAIATVVALTLGELFQIMISDQIVIIAAVALGLIMLFVVLLVVTLGAILIWKKARTKAEAAGVDFSDGLDGRELAIIAGLIRRHKNTEAEKAAVATMFSAAEVAAK